MKKILLFLSFLLMSIGMWGTTTYTKITSNSSLSNGDKVILAQGSSTPTKGVTGWNGNKDAIVSSTESSWVQYEVKSASGSGWQLYDATANNYIKSPGSSNQFLYGTAGTCSVSSDGILMCNSRYLVQNGSYYRMYSSVGSYTPFYVWKVTTDTPTPSTYSVTYNSNGGSGTMIDPNSPYVADTSITTLTNTFTKSGYTFTGWNTQAGGGGTSYNEGDTFTINANTTLYAQWEEDVVPPTPVEGEIFELLTDIENLNSGDEIVILNTGGTYALSTTQNENNRGTSSSFILVSNTVTLTNNTVQVITIGGNTGAWTFNVGNEYLYAASSSKNYLRTQVSNDSNGEWSIVLNGSNEAAITAQGSNTHNELKFNAQNSIFSCYESGQVAVKIYKKVDNCTKTVPVRKGSEEHGTFSLDKTEVCADAPGGTVSISDIVPADGYVFDTIVCVTAKEPLAQLGTVNLNEKKVTGITDSCYIFVSFKEKPNIDIVEWNPNWLKIDVENFTAATATLEDQNTQADIEINYADSLFFSKYFEAASNVKLLGVYNGTNHTIDISSYGIGIDDNSNGFSVKLFSEMIYRDVNNYDHELSFTAEEMLLGSNEEIILITYQKNNAADSAIIKCAKDNSNSEFSKYYRLKTPNLQFNGDDAIALVNPDGNFIDLIGAGTKADGRDISNIESTSTNTGTYKGFMDSPGGWYNEDGINIETNDSNYALSTNRCLLIRKKYVKSGLNAVTRNTTDFITLGGTYGEWGGLQIPGSTDGGTGAGVTNACTGFDDIGSFDYTDYYVAFDTIYKEKPIPGQEDDGYYKIEIPNLDALSCTNLKITVKDASSNVLEEVVKIPIMIKTDATTTDATYFNKKNCDECDVVVLKNKILTVAGTTSANRDIKLYEGAELIVPKSTSYTLNSLALRRENDTVSSLYLNGGTLTVTNKVYFDLYITPDNWHYISLPGDFSLSNVKFTNGKTPIHKKDFWARHYDGKLRAQNLSGGWQAANIDSVFSAGQGFIFGLDDRHKKKEFRFEFNNSILTSETSNKTIPNLYSWGCGDESLRPNHKGWNLIGNPYLGFFNAEIYDKIRVDSLVKVMENGHWTGLWELSNDSRAKTLRYAVIPSDAPEDRDAGGYKSVLLDDMKLSPFICFFVQIGGNDESAKAITMSAARRTNKIVARNYQEVEDDELFLRVKVDDWKTGCFISKNFSDKYEPGDDLESRYPIYQSIGGYKLLYSAINDSIIEHGVQITAPQGTLYLDPKVDVDKFEYIYVNYNDGWFDLLHGETVDIEASTFILQAKRRIKENVTTDIDELKPTNGIYKFTDGNNVYINKNNKIYSLYGNKVK